GVGISIGLSRLFYKLREAKILTSATQSPAEVVVIPIDENQIEAGVIAAASLRKVGVPTLLYTEPGTLKKKLRYANKMGFAHVILIGEKEATNNTVSVKNMETGESVTIPVGELARHLKA